MSSSSCSTSRCIRSPSSRTASASSPSGSAPGWARATSAVCRMLASGERSSCEASATNCCCRSRESRVGRASGSWSRASRWISSRERRLGHAAVEAFAGDLVDLAPDALDGRERAGRDHQVVAPTRSRTSGRPTSSGGTSAEVESSTVLERDGDGDVVLPRVLGRPRGSVVDPGQLASSASMRGQRRGQRLGAAHDGAGGVASPARPRPRARRRPGARRRRRGGLAPGGRSSRSGRPGTRRAGRRWPRSRRAVCPARA